MAAICCWSVLRSPKISVDSADFIHYLLDCLDFIAHVCDEETDDAVLLLLLIYLPLLKSSSISAKKAYLDMISTVSSARWLR